MRENVFRDRNLQKWQKRCILPSVTDILVNRALPLDSLFYISLSRDLNSKELSLYTMTNDAHLLANGGFDG